MRQARSELAWDAVRWCGFHSSPGWGALGKGSSVPASFDSARCGSMTRTEVKSFVRDRSPRRAVATPQRPNPIPERGCDAVGALPPHVTDVHTSWFP